MLAKKKLLNEYRIGRTIGEGAFSKVKVATHKSSGKKVAIKIIKREDDKNDKNKKRPSTTAKENAAEPVTESASAAPTVPADPKLRALRGLSKEVKLLMRLDHPNIIRLYQVIDTAEELYIIMDYASGGELIDYIAAKGSLSEKEGRKFFRQLISAIDHCHLAGVIHRDLKLENMLLDENKNLVLSDFGLGRSLQTSDQVCNTFCGTPLYASPELVSGIKYVGPPADIWSLGIVLFIMISGRPPFRCESISELYFQIKTVKYTCPQNFSKQLQDLLARILVRNPLKRVSMDGLRFDPWVLADDSNPPKRIEPRIKVDERENGTDLDGEIDALLLSIQEFDGMTVYDFKSTGSDGIAIKFHEKDDREKSKSQESTKPSNLPVIPSVTIHDHDAPNQSSSVNEKTGLFPMLTLGRGKAKTDDAASKTMAVPVSSGRQRSKSISPETNAYEMAKKFEALKDMPVSAYVDAAPSVKPAASVVLAAPVHRRRHSVSVGVPNAVPDGFGPSNPGSQTGISGNKSTAAPTEKRDTKSPGIYVKSPSIQQSLAKIHEENSIGNQPLPPISSDNKPSSTLSAHPSSTQVGGHQRRMSIWSDNPAGMPQEEIRTVRLSFQLQNLSSKFSKEPVLLMPQLESVLDQLAERISFGGQHQVERRGQYTIVTHFEHNDPNVGSGKVVVEVEIVRVWLLKMLSVRIKRLSGDAWVYKAIHDSIVNELK